MVIDDALHPEDPTVPAVEYARLAGRPVWKMSRLDPLVDRLLESGASAAEVLDGVHTHMAAAAAAGAVAFKTVLAYRTGLAVDPAADLAAAQRSLDVDAGDGPVPVRRRAKALRDLVFRTALGTAADLGLPVQVHTGFGDSDIRLRESDPLLLEEVLRTPEGTAATVVLIHGSFPWQLQAAYLATVRPHVWVELSCPTCSRPCTPPIGCCVSWTSPLGAGCCWAATGTGCRRPSGRLSGAHGCVDHGDPGTAGCRSAPRVDRGDPAGTVRGQRPRGVPAALSPGRRVRRRRCRSGPRRGPGSAPRPGRCGPGIPAPPGPARGWSRSAAPRRSGRPGPRRRAPTPGTCPPAR
jgi:hypothetical protein